MGLSSRQAGLVAGFLVGDALGAPFGGVKGGHIRQLVGGPIDDYLKDALLFPDRPDKNHLPGLHTIGGQQFIAVLAAGDSEQTGQHPISRAAAHLRDLAEGEEGSATVGALRAPGRPLRRAIARWNEEYPWEPQDHFARDEQSEGASACSFALAALVARAENPAEFARLTHTREAPLAAAYAITEAARMLLECDHPKRIDGAEIARELHERTRAFEDELRAGEIAQRWKELGWGFPVARFSESLSPLMSLLRTGDDSLAEKTIVGHAADFGAQQAVTHAQHGFAPAMVPWVLYRALGPMAPVVAMEDALNRGGETPVAASLVGALMGARHGIEQIAEHWKSGCRALQIALELGSQAGSAAEENWISQERRWTEAEEAIREPLRESLRRKAAESAPAKKKKPQKPVEFEQGALPFAPPPQVWLEQKGDELAPWEKKKLKSERGRKRIDWKEERREKKRIGPGEGED